MKMQDSWPSTGVRVTGLLSWLTLLLMLRLGGTNHFRGGSFITDQFMNQVRVTFRIGWQRSDSRHTCRESDIAAGTLFAENRLLCVQGCGGPVNVGLLQYRCLTFSARQDWTYGEGVIDFTFVTAADVVSIATRACCWPPSESLEYRVQSNVSLVTRADTGAINSSPRAAILPFVTLYPGCNDVLRIPVVDPDGDVVRCRWGQDPSECGDVCGASPGVTLNQDTCTLNFANAAGTFPVALVLEDFVPPNVINVSYVALQFLVDVDINPSACANLPTFSGPFWADHHCIGTPVGTTLNFVITLSSGNVSSTIAEFHSVGFLNVETSRLDDVVNVSWSPIENVTGIHCFLMLNDLNISSVFKCIEFTTETPNPVSGSLSPFNETAVAGVMTITITFSYNIQRPRSPANISLVDSSTGDRVYSVDVTSASGLETVEYTANGGMVVSLPEDLREAEDRDVHVTLDEGVAVRVDCLIANVEVSDTDFWPFTIAGVGFCAAGAPCDQNCTDVTGSFLCSCWPGYEGAADGVTCRDVDECVVTPALCAREAMCTNTLGSFTCACNAGFTGDGTFCSDIDECDGMDTNDCQVKCINRPGDFSCACAKGFELINRTHCKSSKAVRFAVSLLLDLPWSPVYAQTCAPQTVRLRTALRKQIFIPVHFQHRVGGPVLTNRRGLVEVTVVLTVHSSITLNPITSFLADLREHLTRIGMTLLLDGKTVAVKDVTSEENVDKMRHEGFIATQCNDEENDPPTNSVPIVLGAVFGLLVLSILVPLCYLKVLQRRRARLRLMETVHRAPVTPQDGPSYFYNLGLRFWEPPWFISLERGHHPPFITSTAPGVTRNISSV